MVIGVMTFLSLLAALLAGRLSQVYRRQYAALLADKANLIAERDEAIAKHVDIWHAAWQACEEHQPTTQLVKREHDRAMVELLGVVVDSRTAVERGELDVKVP